MRLVVNGSSWENGDWLDNEIEITLIDDSLEIALLREGYDDLPVLLSLEILEWAIKTLQSAPNDDAEADESDRSTEVAS